MFDPARFTGIALYSDFDTERARISTGNAKVNQLVSNARWGMRDNFLDTATDCPQRDERMGWTGDANVFSPTALRLGAPYAFYRKYLHDMALEQDARDGMVPSVIPAFDAQFGNGTAVSLAYGFGNRDRSASQLRRLPQENGGKHKTGFVGTPSLCPALSEAGLDREAYDLLLNEDYPGWLFAVDRGATTIWERWNSLDADGRITGTDMNSMNHYSYGAIVGWLMCYAADLRPALPGYSRALVAPHPSWRLGSCDLAANTAAGTYHGYL